MGTRSKLERGSVDSAAIGSSAQSQHHTHNVGSRMGCGVVGWWGGGVVFLPNSDLISKPEHTVCKNATWLSAAPFLSGGWFAL